MMNTMSLTTALCGVVASEQFHNCCSFALQLTRFVADPGS